MSAMRLPAPGTKLGPCKDRCGHQDCAETRRHASDACQHCGRAIGYETRFYMDPRVGALAHATCEEAAVANG